MGNLVSKYIRIKGTWALWVWDFVRSIVRFSFSMGLHDEAVCCTVIAMLGNPAE